MRLTPEAYATLISQEGFDEIDDATVSVGEDGNNNKREIDEAIRDMLDRAVAAGAPPLSVTISPRSWKSIVTCFMCA